MVSLSGTLDPDMIHLDSTTVGDMSQKANIDGNTFELEPAGHYFLLLLFFFTPRPKLYLNSHSLLQS